MNDRDENLAPLPDPDHPRYLDAEEEDIIPQPRNPPPRDFSKLEDRDIILDTDTFVKDIKYAPRYGSYDGSALKNDEPWADEDVFYEWLIKEGLPKKLAEFLYLHTPEVDIKIGPVYINGVNMLMRNNTISDDIYGIRRAGFLDLGVTDDTDPIVMELADPGAGTVGYLDNEEIGWDDFSTEEIRRQFIPLAPSIGQFFHAFITKDGSIPKNYAKAKISRGSVPKNEGC